MCPSSKAHDTKNNGMAPKEMEVFKGVFIKHCEILMSSARTTFEKTAPRGSGAKVEFIRYGQ